MYMGNKLYYYLKNYYYYFIIIIIIIIIRFFAKLFDRSWSFVLQHFCFQEERNRLLSSLFCSNLRLSDSEISVAPS